jgi:regulator of protease activity HflC (stomatin/prohibitin superfamily)
MKINGSLKDDETAAALTKVVGLAIGLLVLFIGFGSTVTVPQGSVGVVFDKWHGGVQPETLREGWHLKVPFTQTITSYPVSLRSYSTIGLGEGTNPDKPELVSLPTKGGQHIDQQMSMAYSVDPSMAAKVFDQFKGADIETIESDFIRRNVQSVATNITGTYDLMDVLGPKKTEIQGLILEGVKARLAPYGFIVSQVNLGYAKPPEAIEAALQAKMQAEQSADAAKYGLQKAQMDAQAKIATAQGEAKANELIKQQLTPEFIKYQALDVQKLAIEKWNGALPTSMPPNGTVPFLNVNAINEK